MSQDFKPQLVQDATIADITPSLDYAVKVGGSSVNYQRYPAVSTSTSAISFNCQIPSESIVIDREVLIQADVSLQLTITNINAPGGVTNKGIAFNYGWTDSLAPFPLAQLMNTASCQINNVNVSSNVQDIIAAFLRLNDSRELLRYNGMCPSLPDQSFKFYSDALGVTYEPSANNGSLSGFDNQSYDVAQYPRGSHRLLSCTISRLSGGVTADNVNISSNVADVFTVNLTFRTTEPLFLSPFIFGQPECNRQGMAGINQLNFTFNLDAQAKRVLRSANDSVIGGNQYPNNYTHTVSLTGITNASILIRQLSTQPSQLVSAKNVVPYMSFDRYLSTNNQSIPAPTNLNATAGSRYNGSLQRTSVFSSATITSQTLSLSSVPDYFIVFARKSMATQTLKDSDSFLPIQSCQVQFSNVSGLLSTANQEQLWRMSVKNGSQQNWPEFSGLASVNTANSAAADANACGCGQLVRTTGSLLIIDPAYDLSLPNYVSNGSVGQYNFQIQVQVQNNFNSAIVPELVIIAVQSGMLVNLAGTSSVYLGLLNKEIVLSTAQEQSDDCLSTSKYDRMVGGSMLNRIASAVRGMSDRRRMGPPPRIASRQKPFMKGGALDLLTE